MSSISFLDSSTVFCVKNLKAAIAFYVDRLGFEKLYETAEPQEYAILKRGEITCHLHVETNSGHKPGNGTCYVTVLGVDALYSEYKAKGVKITTEISDQYYGMRDFCLQDPDGNCLGFGQEI